MKKLRQKRVALINDITGFGRCSSSVQQPIISVMKKSKIILLDEATSSLDNETQDFIKNSIQKISADYTILIIAHRLSTVKDCEPYL